MKLKVWSHRGCGKNKIATTRIIEVYAGNPNWSWAHLGTYVSIRKIGNKSGRYVYINDVTQIQQLPRENMR